MHEPIELNLPSPDPDPRASALPKRKVALVHYWLVGMRGGEKVLESLCELYPDADIFTLVANVSTLSPTISRHRITTSFLQKVGGVRHYQKMLALMPFALESFDLTPYDLVISSEAGPAKGVVTRPDAVHICYCHSPMRYVWDLYPEYRANAGWFSRSIMSVILPFIRLWDVTTAARVDHFVANSSFVASRISKYYRRSSVVIYPPVDVDQFSTDPDNVEEFYLCAGQITPYKRTELAVKAFTQLGKPLVVVGSGATNRLRQMAGPTVTFVGAVDHDTLAGFFRRCRALVFPGLEDFGIVPLEVMASGRPVIAYGRGGAAETVVDGRTGILFHSQSVEALIEAVHRFEDGGVTADASELREHAKLFGKQRFSSSFGRFAAECERAAKSYTGPFEA